MPHSRFIHACGERERGKRNKGIQQSSTCGRLQLGIAGHFNFIYLILFTFPGFSTLNKYYFLNQKNSQCFKGNECLHQPCRPTSHHLSHRPGGPGRPSSIKSETSWDIQLVAESIPRFQWPPVPALEQLPNEPAGSSREGNL